MLRKFVIGFLAAIVASLAMGGVAQPRQMQIQPGPDSPVSVRHANAPAELQQLEFLIGDWSVALVVYRDERKLAYEARWHNTWIVDGFAIMQEWRDPNSAGAEFRTYNSETGRWEGRNFYSGMNTWTESDGAFANGEFVVETQTMGPEGASLGRERYFDIQPDSFRMVATRSLDGGHTWSAPTYEMVCTRIV